jgi:transcriptional regulator of acetoin/glycerol metabolism
MRPPRFAAAKTGAREQLVEALRQCDGNQTRAAKMLGVSRVTVWNRINKYGINLDQLR